MNEQKGWFLRTFSVGDVIAMLAAVVGVVGGYYALAGDIKATSVKIKTIEQRVDREDIRTRSDLAEIKQMIRDLTSKVDRAHER